MDLASSFAHGMEVIDQIFPKKNVKLWLTPNKVNNLKSEY